MICGRRCLFFKSIAKWRDWSQGNLLALTRSTSPSKVWGGNQPKDKTIFTNGSSARPSSRVMEKKKKKTIDSEMIHHADGHSSLGYNNIKSKHWVGQSATLTHRISSLLRHRKARTSNDPSLLPYRDREPWKPSQPQLFPDSAKPRS